MSHFVPFLILARERGHPGMFLGPFVLRGNQYIHTDRILLSSVLLTEISHLFSVHQVMYKGYGLVLCGNHPAISD